MDNFIQFIFGGDTAVFTPETLVRYMVFVLILSCICSIADSILSVGRK